MLFVVVAIVGGVCVIHIHTNATADVAVLFGQLRSYAACLYSLAIDFLAQTKTRHCHVKNSTSVDMPQHQ